MLIASHRDDEKLIRLASRDTCSGVDRLFNVLKDGQHARPGLGIHYRVQRAALCRFDDDNKAEHLAR